MSDEHPHIRVSKWDEFQHYSDRDPPWIKLYNRLLDDYEYNRLQDASKAHLTGLWLLASRTENRIPLDVDWIASKIGANTPLDLRPLVSAGFISVYHHASEPLSQDASTSLSFARSREAETEAETEQSTSARDDGGEDSTRSRAVKLPDGWEPNENHAEIATEEGVNLDREAEQFRDHAKANGRTQRDWDASFRNWLRKAADFGSGTGRVEEKKETSSLSDEEYERLYGVSG